MSAPHGQSLALPFLKTASAYHGPAGVAGEHPAARSHLVVEVDDADEPRCPAGDLDDPAPDAIITRLEGAASVVR
ncbi:hypothetical protein [Nonomuraea basaltis]|uniref:hypothetical protein n=1 Tax=Nonomuraea basaltis TaxID=2495887 RepID=UPI001F0F5B71|nr:hypothetical protein [Nonomuraea basaltis]